MDPIGIGGLSHFNSRTGQWTAKDAIRLYGGDTNLYSYVLDDPVSLVDLTGTAGATPAMSREGMEVEEALALMWQSYQEMRDANFKGVDKYYHCMAHCRASSIGLYGWATSEVVGYGRELIDFWTNIYNPWKQLGPDAEKVCSKMMQSLNPSRAHARVVSVVAFIVLAACHENLHAIYPDVKAVEHAGSGARSWFPSPLPSSAKQLEEWHNIDTNATVGRFRFNSQELQEYRKALSTQKTKSAFTLARLPMTAIPDWPACLRGSVDRDAVIKCGFEPYSVDGFQIVLDPRNSVSYFWSI